MCQSISKTHKSQASAHATSSENFQTQERNGCPQKLKYPWSRVKSFYKNDSFHRFFSPAKVRSDSLMLRAGVFLHFEPVSMNSSASLGDMQKAHLQLRHGHNRFTVGSFACHLLLKRSFINLHLQEFHASFSNTGLILVNRWAFCARFCVSNYTRNLNVLQGKIVSDEVNSG